MPRSVLIGAGGQTVSEPLRHLELPSLPQVGSEGAALQFGDWLTMATPLMSDLGASSKNWWAGLLMVAEDFYGRWLESTPLERLRLKPAVEIDPGYTRAWSREGYQCRWVFFPKLFDVTSFGPAACPRCQSSTASLWSSNLVEEQNEHCS
jgi:hypothetical protein